MNYTVENLEKSMAKVTITVDADKFEEAMQKSYLKNKKNITVQGFRRGKAPRKMIEKMYGEGVFYEDAANFAIDEAYGEFFDNNDLDIVSRPEIEVVEIGEGKDFVFTATVAVKPEVTLGDYKGVEVAKREVKVMAADVNAEIDKVREQNSRMITVENRGIKKDDTAIIDFVGSVDGVEFQGGTGKDYPLVIGSHSFIDNFEDQIVGHTPGETFDVTVTFPEDYGNEDLNGKEAVFETTLNYIKESVTPELTDDWVKENLGESMSLNSVDELKAFVKSTMLYDNQASDVYTDLHDKASYADELPQTALDYYRDVLLYRIYTNAQKYGTDMNTLLSSGMMGSSYDSVDAYLADANDSIKSITQQALLMQAVAEKTGFKCDTATMNADFGRYYGTTDPSQYVSAYGENYIKMNVLQSDVMQNLIDNVKYE